MSRDEIRIVTKPLTRKPDALGAIRVQNHRKNFSTQMQQKVADGKLKPQGAVILPVPDPVEAPSIPPAPVEAKKEKKEPKKEPAKKEPQTTQDTVLIQQGQIWACQDEKEGDIYIIASIGACCLVTHCAALQEGISEVWAIKREHLLENFSLRV
jgi:hypothetical protein